MAISFAQTIPKPVTANTDDNVAFLTPVWSPATGAGHGLVMCVSNNSFVPTVTRPTGYTVADEFIDNITGAGFTGIYFKPLSAGADANPTCSWSGGNAPSSAVIYELIGTDTVTPLDADGNSRNGVGVTSLAVTTAGAMTAGERVAFVSVRTGTPDGGSFGWTNSFATDHDCSGGAIGHRASFTATAATLSTTGSWASAAVALGSIAVFKAAAVGGKINVWNGSAFVAKDLETFGGVSFATKPLEFFDGGSFRTTSRRRLWTPSLLVPERFAA